MQAVGRDRDHLNSPMCFPSAWCAESSRRDAGSGSILPPTHRQLWWPSLTKSMPPLCVCAMSNREKREETGVSRSWQRGHKEQ